jgi:lipopolysaccharide/colanic/teichoic acid biosynthesis glycosyltransferase
MITASPQNNSRPKTLILALKSSLPVIFVLTGWRLGVFPNVAPTYGVMASAALLSTLALLCSLSLTLALIQRRNEDLLVLTGGGLTREFGRDPSELSIEKGTTRIVAHSGFHGVVIEDDGAFHDGSAGRLWRKRPSVNSWLESDGFQPSNSYLSRKRILDVVCAILMILVTAPLLVLIAIGIKLDSAGPAIFSQERVGLQGTRFTLYKFRSMRSDAESTSGPVWAAEFDDRVTSFGKILRKFRLDEIPQAINVLRGDMSFAGPRPERPYFVNMLREHIPSYDTRHDVKPGITGWAQVTMPYGASIEDAKDKLQYDLYYIEHMSFRQDLLVLLKTVRVVLFGKGR